jgi:cytochrome P450
MALLWIGVVVVALWVIFGFSSRQRKYPPGPSMNVFKKLQIFLTMAKEGKLPHTLEKWHKKYGKILYFGINLGPFYKNLMYSVADPVIAKEVLKKTSMFPARLKGGLTFFVPKSLLGIHENNDMWKKHRTILSKAFTDKYLKQYSEEIISVSNDLIAELQNNNIIQNINKKMADITYRIVACTVLGKDFYSVYPTVGTKTQLDAILKSVIIMSLTPPIFRNFATQLSNSIDIATCHIYSQKEQIMNDILNIRKNSIQGNSMLHFLVHHSADLSNEEIIDEMLALIMAGHETTANALSFAMVCLSLNKEILRNARDEISTACDGSPLTFQIIPKLPLMRAILKETLRLFPVVPIISRVAVQNTTVASYDITPQDRVIINIFQICRDANVFTDPMSFQPERWLTGANNSEELKNYDSTHRFGGGLRVRLVY